MNISQRKNGFPDILQRNIWTPWTKFLDQSGVCVTARSVCCLDTRTHAYVEFRHHTTTIGWNSQIDGENMHQPQFSPIYAHIGSLVIRISQCFAFVIKSVVPEFFLPDQTARWMLNAGTAIKNKLMHEGFETAGMIGNPKHSMDGWMDGGECRYMNSNVPAFQSQRLKTAEGTSWDEIWVKNAK